MYAIGLRCLRCGTELPFSNTAYLCPECGPGAPDEDPGILDVTYDYAAARVSFQQSVKNIDNRRDIFRYIPLLPVDAPGPVLPAGGTPLVSAPRLARQYGLRALYLKDDTRNPTRCLKDRATAIGVTMALDQRHTDIFCASAGNAAISMAGFAAHAGLRSHAFVPRRASATRLAWLGRYGAQVHVSAGNYDQAFDESEAARREHGWYSRNCAFNPYLVEGKKTTAFEIAEDLQCETPDWIFSPSGDGCTLGALGKGFRELRNVGLTDDLPRLVGVQSVAIQPIVKRFTGATMPDYWGSTAAASVAVERPRNALRLLGEIQASDGQMLAVTDDEIAQAHDLLAKEAGIVTEYTTAATLAGLRRLAEMCSLEDQTAVLVLTGGRLDGE